MLQADMRFSLLALALFLTACGGDEAPAVVDTTDAAVTTDAPQTDTVVVAEGDPPDADAPAEAETSPAADVAGDVDASGIERGPEDEIFVGMWAGDDPVLADGTHFVSVPPVRVKLEEAFRVEPGLLDKLSNLDDEPYFLITPIESVGSMLGLTFVSNAKFNDDDRTLHLLVADDASRVFALLTSDSGDTFYRASYDASAANLPADAAAWMSRKGGTDFAELVQQSDAVELGP